MKKFLFIAIIIAQLTGSLEGILMEGRENVDAIGKELKQETTDEPEILVRPATRIFMATFLLVAAGHEEAMISGKALDLPEETTESSPFFIRYRCLRI